MESLKTPYISFVVVSRNDDHGADALRRTQVSFGILIRELDRRALPSELILVDWNPPQDRPLLKDAIQWPGPGGHCSVVNYIVPHAIHRRFKFHDRIAIHPSAGMNCGILRARGQFILPNTIDHLYSSELLDFLAQKQLEPFKLYRADRYDVDRKVMEVENQEEQLAYCTQHILHHHAYIESHGDGISPVLHTNAAGDFLLMSRKSWHRLRGLREADPVSDHNDGLLLYAAHAAGIRELRLPQSMCVYHIDHDSGFMATQQQGNTRPSLAGKLVESRALPRLIRKLFLRTFKNHSIPMQVVFRRGIPTLHYDDWRTLVQNLLTDRHPFKLNRGNWGLKHRNLESHILRRAGWEI